ncbi:MAG: dihydrolipoyl dehydrogenase [Candidatus Izemoplasmatales bacterium]
MEVKMGIIVGASTATVGKILVSCGQNIKKDDVLLQYETKKGNRSLKSPLDGVIVKVTIQEGDTIQKDDVLFELEEEKDQVVASSSEMTELYMTPIVGAQEAIVGKIAVQCGESIEKDQVLFYYETKKGSRPFKSSVAGQITEIVFLESQTIKNGDLLFKVREVVVESDKKVISEVKKQQEIKTDILIIGGGPGGYVAAIYAAKHGKDVVLLEKESLGGTCLNVGCIPTKSFVKSSEVHHSAITSETFGIQIPKEAIRPNMDKIVAHKDSVVDRLVSGIEGLMNSNKVRVIKALGKFVSNTVVEAQDDDTLYTIKAEDIIIATGSKISKIPIPGLELPFVLNSTTALSNRKLPKSIAIVGGGVIGMEFAFIYKNLGVDVSVIEYMDRLLLMIDKDLSEEIKTEAVNRGIKVYTSSKVLEVSCDVNGQAIVTFEKDKEKKFLVAENVLVAIGRQPNLDGLNLEATDVAMDPKRRGIAVNSHMQTNVDHIYAIGDVTNIIQLAHVASHQGIVAVDHIVQNKNEMDYTAIPNVIFTSPEIASVGIGEDECKEKGIDYQVSKFYFQSNGKALSMEETKGYVKLVKNKKTDQLIGASIIGVDASNLISTLTLAIQNGVTDEQIRETVFPHPTTSEVIHEAAMGLGIGTLHQ